MLDPAAEQIQHAKKQRERIYDDDIYFVYSKPPENIPEWACDPEKIKDLPEAHTDEVDDNYDNDIQLHKLKAVQPAIMPVGVYCSILLINM